MTALKQSNDLDLVTAMAALANLLTNLPVLEAKGDKYAELVSSSLAKPSSPDERQRLLSLLGAMVLHEPAGEYSLAVAAQLLGFEPESAIQRLREERAAAAAAKAQAPPPADAGSSDAASS